MISDELQNKIYNLLIDECMSNAEIEETLKFILGKEYHLRWFDQWIDDGCGEDEDDEYVMGVGFTAIKDNDETDIRVYYGNETLKIGCVTFS